MTNTDVKQRITSLQALPALPHLAREALLMLDAGSTQWEELAAIAAFDESMVSALRAAALREPQGTAEATLAGHLATLGLPRVCEILFQRIAPSLFDAPRSNGIDLKTFWSHAFAVARYTRQIARKIDSRYESLAFVAGLLHDIGKPALDRVVQGGYTRALELVRQQGLFALEAERRELGADHTVAGKWLAESWGLPQSLVAAIWLHHHPPGTLDNTPYPVELIEMVALANFLAHGDELETAPQERLAAMDERRWIRLGLDRVDVIEMMRGAASEPAVVPPVEHAALPVTRVEDQGDVTRLRQERDFYESLCGLYERMRPGTSPATQLAVVIDSLRTAFAIPAGICYLTDVPDATPVVLRWHSLTEAPEHVPLKSDAGETGMSASLDELVAALGTAPGGETAGGTAAVHRHGFMALPLLHNNKSIGQLIFKSGQGRAPLSEDFLNTLMRFMRAAGNALARCNAVRDASAEAESLAAAVWKQELSHRHDRKTERLISIGKVAAGAAHEINNPLAVISGKAQLLLGHVEREEDRKSLDVIIEHSQRASGILRDLLQFARPNPPQLMPSRISSLLRAAVDQVRPHLEDEGIQLVEDYAPDLPQIQVDRVQMDQVFQNILRNAEQAMARQGDKLTVRVRPNQDRTTVIIQIIDTGQGIAADVMDKVFEPFFTTQSGNQGTGMGLAVCYGIVEAHRGTITLHSQEGAGTTCTLTLPVSAAATVPQPGDIARRETETGTPPVARTGIARRPESPGSVGVAPEVEAAIKTRTATPAEAPQAMRSPSAAPAPPTGPSRFAPETKGNLLLVDNDAELREVLAEALRNRGYRVQTASDGLEALAEVIAHRVDLVMLDSSVPGVNAPQTLIDEIQKRKPELPVILLIGAAAPQEPVSGSGPRTVLRKPFEVAQLFRTIEESIASRHVA